MSKLQLIQLDDGTLIFVATTSQNDLDTSLFQQVQSTPPVEEEEEMQLVDPNTPRGMSDAEEDAETIAALTEKNLNLNETAQKLGQKTKDILTVEIPLPKWGNQSEQKASATLPQVAQTVGDLVKNYSRYLISNLKDVATTDVSVSKVTLEFGVDLELKTGIPYIAAGGVTSSVKVSIECDLNPRTR